MRKPEKSTAFEHLHWEGDTPAKPRLVPDADREAVNALMALGGFQCSKCRKPLSEATGYVCCQTAHCPFCGEPTLGSAATLNLPCVHTLYRNTDKYWDFEPMTRLWQQSLETRDYWTKILQPTPPGRRLPGQKGPGYPHWTDAQKAEAYPDGIDKLLAAIFTPTLRTFSAKRLHPTLLPYLRPEIRTQMRDIHGHRHDHYFSSDLTDALKFIEDFLLKLEAGTQKLRAMPPEKIIRVVKETATDAPN